jgi:hypothetical protein
LYCITQISQDQQHDKDVEKYTEQANYLNSRDRSSSQGQTQGLHPWGYRAHDHHTFPRNICRVIQKSKVQPVILAQLQKHHFWSNIPTLKVISGFHNLLKVFLSRSLHLVNLLLVVAEVCAFTVHGVVHIEHVERNGSI